MRILLRRAAPTGVTLALLLLSPVAGAQQQPTPTPTPTPTPAPALTPAPTRLPGLETFSLPPSTQTVPAPVIVPVPTPTPTPTTVAPPPVARTVQPTLTATPRERTPLPTPAPTPTPAPAPAIEAPAATAHAPTEELAPASPASAPSQTVATPTPAESDDAIPFWAIPAGLLALLGTGALLVALRRRRAAAAQVLAEPFAAPPPPAPEPQPAPESTTPPLPPPAAALDRAPAAPPQFLTPSAPRAWIEVTLAPRRAGVNLVTATADVDVVVRNSGALPAHDVRVGTTLLSARAGQEGEIGALFASPVDRPIAPPFALAPGEERHLRTLATLGREAINVLKAGERPMFVPVVAVNARYGSGAGEGQTSQAFVVGVTREGASKLAPFWLDGPNRMQQALDARPQGEGIRR